jgi:ubiquitin carboxyl-terminal hydrolase 5/13
VSVCVSQKSEGGLYVDMTSFLAFGRDHVAWNFEKSENPVYLHIVQRRKPDPEEEADRPLKKPTLLAIGMTDLSLVTSCL